MAKARGLLVQSYPELSGTAKILKAWVILDATGHHLKQGETAQSEFALHDGAAEREMRWTLSRNIFSSKAMG